MSTYEEASQLYVDLVREYFFKRISLAENVVELEIVKHQSNRWFKSYMEHIIKGGPFPDFP